MHRLFLPLLTVLVCGCGSTDTTATAFDPAQAPAQPQTQTQARERQLQATFDNGSGRVDTRLIQIGSRVHGTAFVSRAGAVSARNDGEPRLHHVVGQLRGDQVSLRLTPDAVNAANGTLTVAGQLGGTGRYSDRTTGASGSLRVTESLITRGPSLPVVLKVSVPAQGLQVGTTFLSDNNGVLGGNWFSDRDLGNPGVGAGNATLMAYYAGIQLAFLGPSGGTFNFLPQQGASTAPLGPDSDFVLRSGVVENVQGTVVVEEN